jgi:hypothetical protein
VLLSQKVIAREQPGLTFQALNFASKKLLLSALVEIGHLVNFLFGT